MIAQGLFILDVYSQESTSPLLRKIVEKGWDTGLGTTAMPTLAYYLRACHPPGASKGS
nr:hypothetical protein Q903MT_gene2337 [Picea sitchensis]